MGERWGWFVESRDGERHWLGGGTGGELSLTDDPGGPFRTEAGPCGLDRADLRERYGLPEDLLDDVLDWWRAAQDRPAVATEEWEYAHREREHALFRRLRAVVPDGVFVQPANFVPRPVRVRMFVDDGTGIGLWPDTVGWPMRASFDEETLPVEEDLKDRIAAWVREYTDAIGEPEVMRGDWGLRHDRRGHALSRELQAQLGPDYRVEFSPATRAGRLEGLSDRDVPED